MNRPNMLRSCKPFRLNPTLEFRISNLESQEIISNHDFPTPGSQPSHHSVFESSISRPHVRVLPSYAGHEVPVSDIFSGTAPKNMVGYLSIFGTRILVNKSIFSTPPHRTAPHHNECVSIVCLRNKKQHISRLRFSQSPAITIRSHECIFNTHTPALPSRCFVSVVVAHEAYHVLFQHPACSVLRNGFWHR